MRGSLGRGLEETSFMQQKRSTRSRLGACSGLSSRVVKVCRERKGSQGWTVRKYICAYERISVVNSRSEAGMETCDMLGSDAIVCSYSEKSRK